MARPDTGEGERQNARFLILYAAAFAGGAVAYYPFLTVILPVQAMLMTASSGAALRLLAYIAFAGAVTASLAYIAFGWVSDVIRRRRPLIAGGMLASSALLAAMPMATSPVALIGLIVLWQVCLNAMLAPLAAWAGDNVPDAQKGLLGGLLAFAPATGALTGAVVTFTPWVPDDSRHLVVAFLVIVLVTPALLFARPVPMPRLNPRQQAGAGDPLTRPQASRTVLVLWLARLLVQIAEASLFAFLLLWFRSIAPGFAEHRTATILTLVLCSAVIVALLLGRWSDRAGRPLLPIAACAAVTMSGLAIMATATSLTMAIAGYAVFGLASSVFLSLHSGQTLRFLPAPHRRGRDLGLFNLTNTVPSLVMPWLTLALVPVYGFDALFAVLAVLAGSAALLIAGLIRYQDRTGAVQAGRRA
ncbi:MFS transporter [Blastomonas sp. AAP53]|uniref:MFS transporter n=1 Tax=Blastomonas sp. AAP53 TaxID=1248760 RepID=UPI0002D4892A|nr:MFS transporter [Blastomonas sp. AAP53]